MENIFAVFIPRIKEIISSSIDPRAKVQVLDNVSNMSLVGHGIEESNNQ